MRKYTRKKGLYMDANILIVDDDADIRNLLGIYLGNEGFQYIKCDNAIDAIDIISTNKIDLVLLDVMMPGMDGITACMKIREKERMPIIFMSAKVEDMDKIHGLMAGADDYITKPFNPLEVTTRVKVQLRRFTQYNDHYSSSKVLEYEDLTLNKETKQVWLSGKEIRLTPKEYGILEYLLVNKGCTLTPTQIYEHVWREEFYHSEATVMMHIANLREKLIKADPQMENLISNKNKDSKYIKTVWGVGYKL